MSSVFPRKEFKALLATLANIPPAYVTWKGDKEPAFMPPSSPFQWASMRVGASSRKAIGWDDRRQVDNADGSYTTTDHGRRQIVLSIDLFSYAPTEIASADDMVDAMLNELFQPDSQALLNKISLVTETFGPITPLPTTINSRYISAAHVDLTMALAISADVSFPGGNGVILETTGTTSEGAVYDVKSTVHP